MNNQTKVGLFSLITILIFIFGFYFLKGVNLFTTKSKYYAVFDDVNGLYKSNPVTVNGYKIGTVNSESFDVVTGRVTVEMTVDNDYVLYDSCIATVASTDLVGSVQVSIRYKLSAHPLKSGDTLFTIKQQGIVEKLSAAIDPLKDNITKTLKNLDSVLYSVRGALAKDDQTSTIHKLNAVLDNIHNITAAGGTLQQTLNNLKSFTGDLDKNTANIDRILHNVADLTDTLKSANLSATVGKAKEALSSIDTLMYNINNGDGTVSSLIKDKKVYNDLDSAVLSLNVLLSDVKKNPFRYVNVSFFGGKKRDDKYLAKQAKKEAEVKASQNK